MQKNYYIYFLTNTLHSVLYTGVTNDLERRLWQHKNKMIDGFSKKYNLNKLVFFEIYDDPKYAILREKQIKKWNRTKKDFLVNQLNPGWCDLSEDWYKGDPSTRANALGRDDTSIVMPSVAEASPFIKPKYPR